MENITTKLKSRFSQNENIETDIYEPAASYLTAAKKISRFVFKTKKRSLFVFLLVGILAVSGYHLFNKHTPEEKAKAELAAAVASAGKLIILPKDDQPVLATVTDAEALIKQQAFFAGAVNGDQLLLFPRNLKAVIYSPSRKMIVNVGPIQQQPAVAESSQTPSVPVSAEAAAANQSETVLTVEIRNGTNRNGLASQISEELNGNAGYKVLKVSDASKKDYSQTVVIAKTSDNKKMQLANSLVASLNARASSELPLGEKDTIADVLVIIGGK